MIDIGTHNHQHINCLTTLDFDIPIHHRIHIETKGSGDAPPVYLKGCSTPTSHLANCLCKAIIYYREVFIVAPYCIWWKTYKPQRYIGGDPLKMTKCAENIELFCISKVGSYGYSVALNYPGNLSLPNVHTFIRHASPSWTTPRNIVEWRKRERNKCQS